MNQYLNIRSGAEKPRLHRETIDIQAARPVVAGDGEQVGIRQERDERFQILILKHAFGIARTEGLHPAGGAYSIKSWHRESPRLRSCGSSPQRG